MGERVAQMMARILQRQAALTSAIKFTNFLYKFQLDKDVLIDHQGLAQLMEVWELHGWV